MKTKEKSRPGPQQSAAALPAFLSEVYRKFKFISRFLLDPHFVLEYNMNSYTNNMNAFHSPGSGYHSIPHSLR